MTKKPVGLKDFKTEMVPIADLLPYVNNPKAHPGGQVDKIASSIKNFGFLVPLVIDGGNEIIAGHGRYEAAQKLGLGVVPCVRAENLTPAEVRAFRLADNKVAESEWFPEALALELKALEEMDFDLSLTGFDLDELEGFGIGSGDPPPEDPGPQIDRAAELQEKWGTKRGQVWQVGRHRVMCGDSTSAEDVGRLMGGEKVLLIVTSPPYNQKIDGFKPSGMHKEGNWDTLLFQKNYVQPCGTQPDITGRLHKSKALK